MFTLTKFDAARRALAEAHRVDEVKAIRDKAEALRLYFKQQGDSLVMQNQAAEIKLRAERKAGTLLAEMDKAVGGGNGSNQYAKSNRLHDETGCAPSLADIGITKIQSYRFQRVARIPEPLFEQYIQETVRFGGELTTKGLLELHPEAHSPPPHRAPSASTGEKLPHYLDIEQGDALAVLKTLPDESIDMVLTSPPYYGLRDFGVHGQLGLESTFFEYIEKLCVVFDEVKRVLKKEGTCWVNLGDTYCGSNNGSHDSREITGLGSPISERYKGQHPGKTDLPDKCLLQIPSRFAIEMCNRGWILRNELIWHKPNAIPSSAADRFTVDYEKIFFFVKSKKYYFEPQREPHKEVSLQRIQHPWHGNLTERHALGGLKSGDMSKMCHPEGRNMRCVWSISTKGFDGAHFAVYPEELIETPIKSGCPEYVCRKCGTAREKIMQDIGERTWKDTRGENPLSMGTRGLSFGRSSQREVVGYTDCGCSAPFEPGVVLDPFFGAGTTAIVAHRLNRSWIGIELSEEYIRIAKRRLVEHGIYPAVSEKV